jgi:hypothetical protein
MTTITIYFFPKQATKAKASDEYNIVVMMEVIVSSSLPPPTRDGIAYLLVAFFGQGIMNTQDSILVNTVNN